MSRLSVLKRKIDTFQSLPTKTKYILPLIIFTSFWVEISLRFLSFQVVMKWLENNYTKTKIDSKYAIQDLNQIKTGIRILEKYFPFIKCYNRALTARILLRKKGYSSTLYLGFKRDEKNKLKGHAWLKCGTIMITGGRNHRQYTITAVFS